MKYEQKMIGDLVTYVPHKQKDFVFSEDFLAIISVIAFGVLVVALILSN